MTMMRKLIFTSALLLVSCVLHSQSQTTDSVVCVDVQFPDCRIFENKTAADNTSSTIVTDVVKLRTLYTTVNCSDFSYFFICAAAYPYCIAETETLRYPCRDMCLRVKEECKEVTILDQIQIFNCDVYSIGGRCITQDEALIAIKRAGLLPADYQETSNGDDLSSFAKGLTAAWYIFYFVFITLAILL